MIQESRKQLGRETATNIGVRIAVYPDSGGPELTEASAASPKAATAKFSKLVIDIVKEAGGLVPEIAIQEIVENLVHAEHRGVIISVMENGNTVRVSDKGPGILRKERAFEFGFSGATPDVAPHIRGIGAGLGIARAATERAGGTVTIEDNIGGGTVVTMVVKPKQDSGSGEDKDFSRVSIQTGNENAESPARRYPGAVPNINISERQQKVLITVMEGGEIGPSTVADRLGMSVSTAYRDLSILEENGLVTGDDSGKRAMTHLGHDLVEALISTWVR